jgi:hypothetical protein
VFGWLQQQHQQEQQMLNSAGDLNAVYVRQQQQQHQNRMGNSQWPTDLGAVRFNGLGLLALS